MADFALLNNVDHQDVRIITDRSRRYGDDVMLALTFPFEFRNVQAHYPILFQGNASDGYYPVALFGFEQGENLFLDEGGWHAGYIPAMIQREPFLIGYQESAQEGEGGRTRVLSLDMDHPRVNTEVGEPLFQPLGGRTPFLENAANLLETIYLGHRTQQGVRRRLAGARSARGADVRDRVAGRYPEPVDRVSLPCRGEGAGVVRRNAGRFQRQGLPHADVLGVGVPCEHGAPRRTQERARRRGTQQMTASADLRPMTSIDCPGGVVPDDVIDAAEPVVLRGLIRAWPAVRECSASIPAAAAYLAKFWTNAPVTAYVAKASINGRFSYNDDFTGFNFDRGKAPWRRYSTSLPNRTGKIVSRPSTWVPHPWTAGSPASATTTMSRCRSRTRWRVSGSATRPGSPRISTFRTIGLRGGGKRRFTLLPPDQIDNLYVGPLDPTPSGQAISLVDFNDPDLARYPRFRDALEQARSAVLGPGDAIRIPSMWWHHIESLAHFNLLINYWWCTTPASMGSPTDALMHAILSLRDLPERQREAWRGSSITTYSMPMKRSIGTFPIAAGGACRRWTSGGKAVARAAAEQLNR